MNKHFDDMRNFCYTTLLLTTLLFASCLTNATEPERKLLSDITELDGVWHLKKLNNTAIQEFTDEEVPSFIFLSSEKSISGTLPCNRFFGYFNYDLSTPDCLHFRDIGQTLAMCHLSNLEEEILNAIKSVQKVRITDLSTDSIGLILYDSSDTEIISLTKSKL